VKQLVNNKTVIAKNERIANDIFENLLMGNNIQYKRSIHREKFVRRNARPIIDTSFSLTNNG